MLFDLPDHNTLYQALLVRDTAYDGQAYVCVSSTGVFCRLTCPARKPKPENCTFFGTVGECIDAGYRACKRCHPLQPMAMADPAIAALLAALDERPDFRWREGDIERMGFDLSTVRRSFKRQFGMTFLEMARQRRLRDGFETIADGGAVIAGQLDAGFESASAFRAAFLKLIGTAPGNLSADPLLFADWVPTPLGDMIAVSSRSQLHLLEFFDRKALRTELRRLAQSAKGHIGLGRTDPSERLKTELGMFFKGRSAEFQTPLAYHGSEFARAVWTALRHIPAGQTRSYSDIAVWIGRPNAVRAVARANGANQIALVIPCHRVIGADGSLTGYGGGLWRKQKLLEIERQYLPSKKDHSTHVTG
ncbi:bifunctional transcriptional activator/DNA repair enzyme AdaA [Roseobacter sinensis]|uniref:Trifunctional transcriptional activator/DNA repair protein Ada/methylated-DNA--[protein]-cysteine S-methyltransferase n=1 Tax=Roseobacter sinensis TaxID=2931391 RepID=A0ABT3BAK1_9RHOB|nr:trifunctional transcriptional activator/DNA repair protein Ada/methylated-DNA--[protein]-cysteine S-methyltransferase [Roseobacter sp. WL0113]MCV3270173.1 trifunctional transcriptional activator/DNA repair protein Ada/methylated-DNA--[protein]-cysteine S-methyltransferase [Roseobacter sp. WL0113]